MLDEQQPRHLPAGRDFIRKRHPFVLPRAATIGDDLTITAPLTAPITLTVISTISNPTSTSSASAKSLTTTSLSSLIVSTSTSSSSLTISSSATSSSSISVVPLTSSVSVAPTSSAPGSTDAMMDSSSTPTNGLSGGAVAAIAIGVLVLVASAAVLIFRRTMQKRREQKRTTARWLSGFGANLAAGSPSGPFPSSEKFGNGNPPMNVANPSYGDGYAFTGTFTSGNGRAVESGAVSPTAPPASYNNAPATAGFSPRAASASILNKASIVRYTFVPNLPDELAILNGEVLDVLQEYDDGWALCTNSKGETGMVPLECLGSGSDTLSDDFGERSRRSSRRVSSLSGRI